MLYKKNIRPRYWPDIFKNPHSILSNTKNRTRYNQLPQISTPRDLVSAVDFDKTCLGLDILYLLSFSVT
jgi:hypothetical protein